MYSVFDRLIELTGRGLAINIMIDSENVKRLHSELVELLQLKQNYPKNGHEVTGFLKEMFGNYVQCVPCGLHISKGITDNCPQCGSKLTKPKIKLVEFDMSEFDKTIGGIE